MAQQSMYRSHKRRHCQSGENHRKHPLTKGKGNLPRPYRGELNPNRRSDGIQNHWINRFHNQICFAGCQIHGKFISTDKLQNYWRELHKI